jgi:hypothetical protein
VTVISSEQRLGMTTAQMPRVNLIPPEIAEKALFRKVQIGLGAGVAVAVGVVGLLTLSGLHSVSTSQASLDKANARATSLTAQKAKYSDVTALANAAAAAQAQLTTAMGQEVRYSQLMHDISLSIPSTVWLKGMTFTQAAPAAPTTAGTQTAGTAGAATTPAAAASLGTVTFLGVGFDHNDLALWLESLAGLKAYSDPYFSASTEELLTQRKVVNFTSTGNLTPAALSGRYTKPLGG